MKNLYQQILNSKAKNQKLLAILIDPEKVAMENVLNLSEKIQTSLATHIFVGGSTFSGTNLDELIAILKRKTQLPVLIFPGHPSQISNEADGILFLSLLSGRNPEYLIEHHINSVEALEKSNLEIIPTGYLLIDGGKETAVQRVSQTQPIEQNNIELAYKTAKAGEFLGKKTNLFRSRKWCQPTCFIRNDSLCFAKHQNSIDCGRRHSFYENNSRSL